MRPIFVVEQSEADTARKMEQKLISLPESAGILFVGVTVMPDPLEKRRRPLYRVVIGCTKERESSLMHVIAQQYLREFVEDVRQLVVEAHRGIDRTSIPA